MRRLVIAAALGAAVVGTAVPSLAQSSTPKGTLPVGVTYSTKGGVFVGTTINGQPGAGAWVANGRACVGFSYQIPQCATLPPVTIQKPSAPAARPAAPTPDTPMLRRAIDLVTSLVPAVPAKAGAPTQQLPPGGVVVYHDDTRTAVGVGDVGVVYYSDGYLCPVVSTQKWPCVQVQLG